MSNARLLKKRPPPGENFIQRGNHKVVKMESVGGAENTIETLKKLYGNLGTNINDSFHGGFIMKASFGDGELFSCNPAFTVCFQLTQFQIIKPNLHDWFLSLGRALTHYSGS